MIRTRKPRGYFKVQESKGTQGNLPWPILKASSVGMETQRDGGNPE